MPGLFEELKRRNVFKVGTAYVVLAWLLAQITDVFLEPFGAPDWVIKTILLVLVAGFPLALFFAWAFEMTPEGIKKEKDVDRNESITHETGQKLNLAIIFILVLALGYFAFDKFVLDVERDAELVRATEDIAAAAEAKPGQKSIAVLPFVNMSEDTSNEYFSDGISEEILNSLARVKELKVAGRTSSFAFKGQNQDLRKIGDALGVEHILEGSVRKAGAKVRITAQLIQVDDGFHLWSDTYDRELNDVFAIQDEIATAILTQLKAHLLDGEQVVVTTTRTDSEAYDLYLLAKQRMYERTGPTIQSAADLLDRAIAVDPEYAPAYAQRAIANFLLSEGAGSYGEMPIEQSQSQGKLYLDKALELDPNLAEAWAGLGLYFLNEPTATSWQVATEHLHKALSLNPGLIDASNWLNNAYQGLGKPAEAYRTVMDMVERDPLYRPGVRNAINGFIWLGELEKALAHLEQVRPLIPNDSTIFSSKAAVMRHMGEPAKGIELADRAVDLQPSNSVARLTRNFLWMDTHQYERAAEEGEEWIPVFALTFLGRAEEASILAFKRADEQADIATLFSFLNLTGRSDELVAYLEERWVDLDALREAFPPYGGIGDVLMIDVALAYSRMGNQQRFNEALNQVRLAHDDLKAQGVNNMDFFVSEASYQALAGDLQASLDYLGQAFDRGMVATNRITDQYPCLEPLEGNERFESIQSLMIEKVNSERKKLNLEPATI
jgi:TolB-like protein/Tfp pilus assembly protein PilF